MFIYASCYFRCVHVRQEWTCRVSFKILTVHYTTVKQWYYVVVRIWPNRHSNLQDRNCHWLVSLKWTRELYWSHGSDRVLILICVFGVRQNLKEWHVCVCARARVSSRPSVSPLATDTLACKMVPLAFRPAVVKIGQQSWKWHHYSFANCIK